MKKIFGYKVLVSRGKGKRWQCPFFDRPENWHVRKGAIWEADFIDEDITIQCGHGVNFWNSLNIARVNKSMGCDKIGLFMGHGCIWKVQVVKRPYVRGLEKSRVKAVKLIKKVWEGAR